LSFNYSDGLTKLFSDLYLPKILDISAKSFFPCMKKIFRESSLNVRRALDLALDISLIFENKNETD